MPQSPPLIIITGPPGAGKSTLALQLSAALPCPLISRDAIRAGLVWGDAQASDHASVNHLFHTSVTHLLRHGSAVICEAAFQHPVWQTVVPDWQACAHIVVICCHIDARTALQRISTRLHQQPWRTQIHQDPIYIAQLSQNSGLIDDFHYLHITTPTIHVDTTQPVDLAMLTQWIRAHH